MNSTTTTKSITRQVAPCWRVLLDRRDLEPYFHYQSRAEALRQATALAGDDCIPATAPYDTPCWTVHCAGCGTALADPEPARGHGPLHALSPDDATLTETAEGEGWTIDGVTAWCPACCPLPTPAAGTPAAPPAGVADQALASFTAAVTRHKLTPLRDDGLYRHLRFRGIRSAYWFDIITWPGNLAFTGDMGSYLFGRVTDEDMLAFFRGKTINPGYWSEKAKAADPGSGIRRHSADVFLQRIAEEAAAHEQDFPGLTAAVQAAVPGDWFVNPESEHDARQFLNDFEYRAPGGDDAPVFRFADTWEWDLTDYGFHYLWCCHAIVWGISQYDKVTTGAPTAVPPIVTLALPPVPDAEAGRP